MRSPHQQSQMQTHPMIRQIAPLFFTTDIPGTMAYYKDKLGFECLGTWQDPPFHFLRLARRVYIR